jgi:hypothetical protein
LDVNHVGPRNIGSDQENMLGLTMLIHKRCDQIKKEMGCPRQMCAMVSNGNPEQLTRAHVGINLGKTKNMVSSLVIQHCYTWLYIGITSFNRYPPAN